MQFTVQQENSHLRNQNTTLRRRIAELESETGMDTYRQRCKDEAEKQVKELSRELNDRDGTISRQQKSIDKLTASLVRTKEEADRFKEKAEQEASAKTELSKKVNSLNLVLQGKDRKIERLEQENMEMKGQIASLTTQVLELNTKVSELEDANGKMNKELHTNSGNSGTPTSRQRLGAKPPVVNSRTPSDKAPGGQPNHPGHKRCQSVNACGGNVRIVGANDPLWNDPNYIFEGYSIKRSFTPVMVMLEDIYIIPSFRHIVTGAHKQVEHPSDLNNEVSFSPEYKAKVLAANQCLNLSVENVQKLIDIFTHQAGGKPSTGFISELPIEFATKSRDEQAKIYQQLCRVHTLHVDGTVVKVGKRQYNITILVSGGYTMYFFRPMKGKAGVKDTPIEETTAILVHDHDVVYYTYGCNHQECLEHILRYLTRSIEVETALSWAKEAMELLQKMIHAAKEADRKWAEEHPDEIPHSESDIFVEDQEVRKRFSDEIIAEYKRELLEVTQKGLDEYERHPAKTWFKEGYNTCKRMHDDPDYYLLFLSDDRVDATNADAEVKARGVKRKVAVALDFRGLLSIVAYCEGNTVINTYMAERKTTLGNMADIFRRDLTLEDTLCIKKTLVGIYASALESDRNIMKRNQKEMDKLTEQLTGFLEQKAIAQKEYENSQKQRIEEKGEASAPSDEEIGKKDQLIYLEHMEYCVQNEIRNYERKIEYDRKHLQDLQKQSDKNDENIASLEERILKQEDEKSKKQQEQEVFHSQKPLLGDDSPEVKPVKQGFEACMEKFNQAIQLRQEKMEQFFNAEYSPKSLIDEGNTEDEPTEIKKERAAKELQDAAEVLAKVIEEMQQAQKELDSARKGYKKRAYRKRGKKHRTSNESVATA